MSSVNDWAAKAARQILGEIKTVPSLGSIHGTPNLPRESRIAAIIAVHAKPMIDMLREAKKNHTYLCKRVQENSNHDMPCTCGADEWNARVDAVLAVV